MTAGAPRRPARSSCLRHARIGASLRRPDRRRRACDRVRVGRRAGRRAARRVPARGPGLARDVEGLSAGAVRGRRHARPRVLAPRLRTLDAARGRRALARRRSCTGRRTTCCRRCSRISGRAAPPWLFGHSDGGVDRAAVRRRFPARVAGVVAVAPHVFVEDVSRAQHRGATRTTYVATRPARAARALPRRSRFGVLAAGTTSGSIPRSARGTSRTSCPAIRCPVLAVQGEDDEYGTMAQVDRIRPRRAAGARRQAARTAGTRRTATSRRR